MKKNGFKRTLAALLVLTMILVPLTACKKGGEEQPDPSDDYVYVPNYVQLPKEITSMQNPTCIGDNIYFLSYVTLDSNGNVMTQEELDAYYARMDEYYSGLSSAAKDVAASEAPVVDSPASDSDVEGGDSPFEELTYETRLCAVNKDGTNYRQLPDYVPPKESDGDTYSNVDRIMSDNQGNLWLLQST